MQSTDKIQVLMTAAEWNLVLTLLAENPFKTVAPIIAQIQQQAAEQEARATMMEAMQVPETEARSANGHDLEAKLLP